MYNSSRKLIVPALLLLLQVLSTVRVLHAGEYVYFLDGARVIESVHFRKGTASLPLPPSIVPGSLRVTPDEKGVLDEVVAVSLSMQSDSAPKVKALHDRRDALKDRLAALATKEAVFMGAAKSQSSRLPKRSKTNPDPVATIRQGTEYAVAQLEAVYRARRIAERDLAAVEKRLTELSSDSNRSGSLLKLSSRTARTAEITYLITDSKWSPRYTVRRESGERAVLTVRSGALKVPGRVALGNMLDEPGAPTLQFSGALDLSSFDCRVTEESAGQGKLPARRLELLCPTITALPSGNGACFVNGTYMGPIDLPTLTGTKSFIVGCGEPLPVPAKITKE